MHLREAQVLRCIAEYLQLRTGLQRHRHGYRFVAEAREIVGHAHADLSLISWGQHIGHVRRQHKVAAHRGGRFDGAHEIRRHRHRHHPQLAVEVIGHGIAHVLLAIHIDDARPVHHRLVAFALERIELAADSVIRVAAGRRHRHQLLEVRQDQIKNLRGAHFEHALAEEELERIPKLIAGDLQNALVYREHHDLGRMRRVQLERHRLSWLDQRRRIERERVAARVHVHRERHDAIAQRAHENLVRRRIADVLHVDIAVTLEARWNGDMLNRTGGIGMEPRVSVDLVALDSNQTATRIRRANRDLHRLALGVVMLAQVDLQLCIAIQRTGHVGVARHRILDAIHFRSISTPDNQRVVARLVGRQRVVQTSGRNRQRIFADRRFLQT